SGAPLEASQREALPRVGGSIPPLAIISLLRQIHAPGGAEAHLRLAGAARIEKLDAVLRYAAQQRRRLPDQRAGAGIDDLHLCGCGGARAAAAGNRHDQVLAGVEKKSPGTSRWHSLPGRNAATSVAGSCYARAIIIRDAVLTCIVRGCPGGL